MPPEEGTPAGTTSGAVSFLVDWSPDGPWALTSIIPDGVTTTHTFPASQKREMGEWIQARQGVENLYFHVNPLRRSIFSKASKEDVERLAWLHVDIDPRVGEDHDKERERALKLLQQYPKPPTLIVDSGGGFQGFWKLEEDPSLVFHGDVPRAQELEAFNIQLETEFGADHCHNVDRIMRIPGTLNVPNRKKLKKGRTVTLSKVVEFDRSRVYAIRDFIAAVRVQRSGDTGLGNGRVTVRVTGNVPPVGVDELRDWAKDNGTQIKDHTLALIATGDDPLSPGKYASRSEALFKVCCDLVRANVPDEMIYAVITGPNEIASSVREKRDWESYAQRQIERAHEDAINPVLREMNEKHAVIGSWGGKCRIIEIQEDAVMGRTRIVRQTFEDFRNRYNHRKVVVGTNQKTGEQLTVGAATFWLGHEARRQYEYIVFAPNRSIPEAYNLWQGFACPAVPGDKHHRYLEHIRENVCMGNEAHYEYLIQWMARAVQEPERTGEVAVILRGKRGTGKSKFVKVFGSLFGRHFLQIADSKHLVGSFNSHLRDAVVVFGDEAFFAGDKRHEGVLKTLITEENVFSEAKGIDAEQVPNYVHVILASNEDWVVPAGVDERRFLVLDVGDGKKKAFNYFAEMDREMDAGGRENLLHFLLSRDLSKFQVRDVPDTEALRDQKVITFDPHEEWLFNKLRDGRWFSADTEWKTRVSKDRLFDNYASEMDKRRVQYRVTRTFLTQFFVRKACPPGSVSMKQTELEVPVQSEYGGEYTERRRTQVYVFPDLGTMRSWWDENFGGPHEWPAWEGTQEALSEEPVRGKTPF